jgi:hypothetical protein
MRVKELRQKLADFGEKNRKHYESAQKKDSQVLRNQIGKVDANEKHLEEEIDGLAIDTKPSTASTSPSSSYEDEPSPQASAATKVLLGPFLNKQAVGKSYSFDSSSSCGSSGSDSTLPPPPQYSSSSELEHVMGKEHTELLEKQAPTVLNSKSFAMETASQDEEVPFFHHSPTGSMHNSTLLRGALLTKSTLDSLCQEDSIPEEEPPALPHCTSSTGASIHTADLDMAEDIDSIKSYGSKDSDAPSIVPGALSPKMANMFFNTKDVIPEENPVVTEEPVVVRRKTIHPEDLPFLKAASKEDKEPVVMVRRKQITPADLPFLKTSAPQTSDPNKASEEINPKPRNTSVGQGIRKFGGRKSRIERRKDELSKKWAQSNSVAFVKKETWEFCKKSGGYKKKVYIEKEVKEEAA